MGMYGAYVAHFYCDVCNGFFEPSRPVDTPGEARKVARAAGWRFLSDGTVLCNQCEPIMVLPAERRQGGSWKDY